MKTELAFIRFSKQYYWENCKKGGCEDDILIGSYDLQDGGCDWEFAIKQINFNGDCKKGSAIQICIFEDALQALKNSRIVKLLIDLQGIDTLNCVELILKKHNIKESIKHKK